MVRPELSQTRSTSASATTDPAGSGRLSPVDFIWNLLCHPGAIVVPALCAFLLAVAGLLLPQMPGQLNQEPATAARWLTSVPTATGALGDLWRGLGLYNVLYHPLLHAALVLLALALAVRLAQQIGFFLALRQWPRQSGSPVHAPGVPAPLRANRRLHRVRSRIATPPNELDRQLQTSFGPQNASCTRYASAYSALPQAQTTSSALEDPASVPQDHIHREEVRYLVQRHLAVAIVPVLVYTGMLLATGSLWAVIVFGWSLTSPVLAPGDEYQSISHGIHIRYQTPPHFAQDDAAASAGPANSPVVPPVILRVDSGREMHMHAEETTLMAGNLRVEVNAAAPGLLLTTTTGDIVMRRLGQSETATTLGVILPQSGGEETVLLPTQSAGLRIVRRAGDQEPWLIEYYATGDVQPRARWPVNPDVSTTIGLPAQVIIHTEPAAGLQFQISYLPGQMFVWLMLAFTLLAAAGLFWRPFFALLQLGPWYGDTVLTLQTTDPSDPVLADIQKHLPPPEPRQP